MVPQTQGDDAVGGDASRPCPACGSVRRRADQRYRRDNWVICGCADCGFVYLQNPPASEALVDDYAWEKTFDTEAKRRKTVAPALYGLDYATRLRTRLFRADEPAMFVKWFGAGRVLDIGCGQGARIKPPLVPFGIELSRELARQANAAMGPRGGWCVHATALEGLGSFADEFFEGVVMRSYLEHEVAPQAVLAATHRVLRPGGKIYVKVPNFGSVNRKLIGKNWCGFRYPDHVNYFTPTSLRRMAEACGYDMSVLNKWNLSIDDNIHVLLQRA